MFFEEIYLVRSAYEAHLKKTFKTTPSDREWLKESQPYMDQLEKLFEKHPDKNATLSRSPSLSLPSKSSRPRKKSFRSH